jgi:hypothetical protein
MEIGIKRNDPSSLIKYTTSIGEKLEFNTEMMVIFKNQKKR